MSQFPWLFHSLKFSFDMSENKLTPVNCFHVPGTVLSIGSSLPRNGHNPHVTANQQYNALFTQRRLSFGNSFSRNFFFCAAKTRQTSVNNTNSLKFQTRVSWVRCLINNIVFKRIKNGGQHLIFCSALIGIGMLQQLLVAPSGDWCECIVFPPEFPFHARPSPTVTTRTRWS